MLLQLTLHAAGVRPGRLLGLSAEAFRFFPTVLTAYVVLLLAWRRGMTLRHLGFVRPRSWRPALYAWAGAVMAGPVWAAAMLLLGLDPHGPYGGVIRAALPLEVLTRAPVLLWAFTIVVLAPVVEEVIFRALLYRGVRARWPLLPALLLTGLVFAAFHFDAARFVPLLLVGALLAWAYDRSGSLWASIVPHAGLNAMTLAVLVFGRG